MTQTQLTVDQKKQLIIEAQYYADGLKRAGRKQFSEVEYAEEDFISGATAHALSCIRKDEEIARLRKALDACAKLATGREDKWEEIWKIATEALK